MVGALRIQYSASKQFVSTIQINHLTRKNESGMKDLIIRLEWGGLWITRYPLPPYHIYLWISGYDEVQDDYELRQKKACDDKWTKYLF